MRLELYFNYNVNLMLIICNYCLLLIIYLNTILYKSKSIIIVCLIVMEINHSECRIFHSSHFFLLLRVTRLKLASIFYIIKVARWRMLISYIYLVLKPNQIHRAKMFCYIIIVILNIINSIYILENQVTLAQFFFRVY